MKLFTVTRTLDKKWYLVILSFGLCLLWTSPLLALSVNSTAPAFTLVNLEGKGVSLSDYQGSKVILKLGTTWCPGCRDQSQELQKVDSLINEAGITIIEVFLDDPSEDVSSYLRAHPMKSRVVALLGDKKIMRDYGVYAIPRLIILSSKQKVMVDSTGMAAQQIKAWILQKE